RPCHLSRSGSVDWSTLLSLMTAAAQQGRDPFAEAVRVQERLFTVKPIFLGVEESLKHPVVPCGLKTDAERARHVRKLVREMQNSRGEWETMPPLTEKPLKEIYDGRFTIDAPADDALVNRESQIVNRSVLSEPAALEKVGHGTLVVLREENGAKIFGRCLTVAERLRDDRIVIAKWIRRITHWNGRQTSLAVWNEKIAPLVEQKLALQKTPIVRFENQEQKILALVSIADLPMRVPVDKYGVALWRPATREVLPYDCARCSLVPVCKQLPASTGTALLWRRLNLVDVSGAPTLRGKLVSFFSQGDGLAIAAALEDEGYPLDELIYDLANLDAGFRFCGDENRWGGRLADACHRQFGLQNIPGYLENGMPPKYGAGAEQIVASVHKNPLNKHGWITDLVGPGDIDRVIIEWRSLLRQIGHAPDLDWPRWRALQAMAKTILNETESPTLTDLPPLEYYQTKRVDHRLILRRH
ncbi:MAG TPA: DEAD/DEAH box helicase, partial [Verrucomicrobiae bacterium]|nr:DEAD/DEAH box helicase [Verrucomicrobiae bacterium]